MNPRRIARKTAKVILYGLISIVGLLLLVIVLLRIPAVQTKVAGIATQKLSKQLNSKITIDKVAINFVDNVSLKGIYIEDQKRDTLLYAGNLNVDIKLMDILKRVIEIQNIVLEDARIRLVQDSDSMMNYQFIIDKFSKTDTTKEPGKPYVVDIRKIALTNIVMSADLLQEKDYLRLKSLEIDMREFDLARMFFNARSINIDKMYLASYRLTPDPTVKTPEGDTILHYPLSTLPVSLKCNKMDIRDSRLIYEVGPPSQTEHFTSDLIHADELNLSAGNIVVDSGAAQLSINNISGVLNERFRLNTFRGDVLFNETRAQITDFEFATPESRGKINATVEYKDFADLLKMTENLRSNIRIDSMVIAMADVLYFVPSLAANASFKPFMHDKLRLHTHVSGKIDTAAVKYLHASIADTRVDLSGTMSEFTDLNKMYFSNATLAATTTAGDIRKFAPKSLNARANRLGRINLKTTFSGNTAHLRIRDLDLNTQGQLEADISGTIRNVTEPKRIAYDLDVRKFQASHNDALAFTDSLPKMTRSFETVMYKGTLEGTMYEYSVKGGLFTNIGDVHTDLDMKFNNNYSNATYDGDIDVVEFDLGKLLANDSLGILNMTADIEGEGIAIKDLNTTAVINIQNIGYNSYTYSDINVNGSMVQQQFEGDVSINDPNLVFDFNGLLNINDTMPIMKFTANLDTINLEPLNLTGYPLQGELAMEADLTGRTVDDVEGTLVISDISLKNEDKQWATDSITFSAEKTGEKVRSVTLNAPFAQMSITGNYSLSKLHKMVLNFGDQYFPFSMYIGGKQPEDVIPPREEQKLSDEKIDFSLALYNPVEVTQLFEVDLRKLDSARLTFSLDAPEKLINLDLQIPEVQYAGIYANAVSLTADNKAEKLAAHFSVDSVSISKTVYVPGIFLDASFNENKATVGFFVENDTGGYSLGINSILDAPQNDLLVSFQDPFYLNNETWDVTPKEPLVIKKGAVDYPTITLTREEQQLQMSGDTSTVALKFTQFELNNIFDLVQLDSTEVTGKMNGDLNIGVSKSAPLFTGDLEVREIAVNEQPVGHLALKGESMGNAAKADVTLTGYDNDVRVDVNYDLGTKVVDGNIDINSLSLPTFQPFFKEYASEASGIITGNLSMTGTTNKPDINGELVFKDASARVASVGTKYTINSGTIRFTPAEIQPTLVFVDELNRNATLRGSVRHNYFKDISFDLNLNSPSFTFLDSPKPEKNALFYGKFVASLDAHITGDLKQPKINAKVTTLKETDLSVQLISPQAVLTQESYIIFFDSSAANYTVEQIDSIAQARYQVKSSIELNLNVDITEDATLRLIIDPMTGDNLEIRGDASLVVKIPETGDVNISGIYTVKDGNYRFSYQKFLKREFAIVGGSRIIFSGNPMNARLDLKARYDTEASTAALVKDDLAGLSRSESNTIKKKSDVSVFLNIDGKLSDPVLTFDIQVPSDDNSPIGSSVERALNRIKQNESDLNKEVFSLLLFNSFTGGSSTGNITTAGAGTAVRSVGNLINNQLSKLTSNTEGFEINIDLDQYENQLSESGGSITELGLGISQSLMNDRLVISVGSNVALESDNPEDKALSNVGGNFVLEYKITESGKYRVRVFQKADYDALYGDNVWQTGAGFSYQTKFGKLKKKKSK